MVEETNGTSSKGRHVRFAEEKEEHGPELTSTRNGEGTKQIQQPSPPPPITTEEYLPRRIEIKDPRTHLAVLTFMMFFLILIAFKMDDASEVKHTVEHDAARGRLPQNPRGGRQGAKPQGAKERAASKIEEAFNAEPRRKDSCAIYLASTSLPGSQAFGIFAGSNFEEGATVLNISKVAYSVNGVQGEPLLVSHYGFLLGHHYLLNNVQGGPMWTNSPELDAGVLKATRSIEEGEEIFLTFEGHPSNALGGEKFSFPVESDYILARDIIKDELDYLRPFRGGRGGTKPDEGSFRLIRKTVAKINRHAAMMLPLSTQELLSLDLRGELLGYAAMRNRTSEWLRRFGHCLDDAELRESEANSVALFAKRPFNFGDVVLPLPLYATTSDSICSSDGEECSAWQQSYYNHCFGHNATSMLLCPLSSAILASPSEDANVVLRWSAWNAQNKESQKHAPDHVIKSFSQSLSWDLVAVREIEAGEEITYRVEKGSTNFGRYIPKDLLPAAWRNLD